MTQYIQKLPAVFQTVTEKKFFDATFDQVFSKRDSEYLAGYIGRRDPGSYNPITDFYLPEPSKNRTWWQLEATAFARNPDATKTNIFFYDDLLERIEYYGGNTLNQDRLFESEYYSFGPPIDYDMFINYTNYYWIEQGLDAITITGVLGSDIIGQPTYTTPPTATPPNFKLTSGMTIILTDDPVYNTRHVVENMGGCIGIRLVERFPDYTAGTIFEFLPWDGYLELSTGRIIYNLNWDITNWEIQAQPGNGDYITIERGALDRNAWSRTNKWFHIDAINATIAATGIGFPTNATRALRPIIQFNADLILYKSGTQFRENLTYGFRDDIFGNPLLLANYQGELLSTFNTNFGIGMGDGDLVCFMNDQTPFVADYFPWDTGFSFGPGVTSSGVVVTISSTAGLLPGMVPYVSAGVGLFAPGTAILSIDSPTTFSVSILPIIPLSGGLTEIEVSTWDALGWDSGDLTTVNHYIYQVNVLLDGTINFAPYTSWATPVLEGDIVFIIEDAPYDGAQRGSTWYYSGGVWAEAFNDKISTNQPPLFLLFDHNGIMLDDATTYPQSTFEGSKIFSYKINTEPGATVDPVLGFPIVYTSLGQSSDIVFQNNLITDRYTYSSPITPINGYYYYKTSINPVLYNAWNLYDLCNCPDIVPTPPVNCIEVSKQRVIDKYVVGYGSEFEFRLSVTPYGYPAAPDIIVSVNGIEIKPYSISVPNGYTFIVINNSIYVNLTAYLTTLFLVTQSQPPVVELLTYTYDLLDPAATGYFEIPQQLEANPNQLEVSEISGSDLIQQFSSIIANQIGFVGAAFGGPTNYRDTRKNGSIGSYILQNVTPALKSMLISSSDDLDFIISERFSQDEYTKFKSRYVSTATRLINQGFNPVQYHTNTIVISDWVNEILKTINVSKEFSNAFAYSYMVASGTPTFSETQVVPGGGQVILANYIDLNNPRNVMYIYDVTIPAQPTMLLIDIDYTIIGTNNIIEIQLDLAYVGQSLTFYLYQNPIPAYIPSTPTKVGAYSAYIPRMEWDTSYIDPTWVIIGHDGSKAIAYGTYNPGTGVFSDYRDALLLELEKRIYNGLEAKFRNQYYVPLRVESVKSGYFRQTRYTRQEYLDITESYLNKWGAKYKANYRVNDWITASQEPAVVPDPYTGNIWKLYNYRLAVNASGNSLNLPGNWKGIFQYYYDTYYPDTRPWEMLGFSEQPSWWVSQYGPSVTNTNAQQAWPNTLAYALMWADLEFGIIRQGPSAIYDPITLLPQEQPMWARPGLSSIIPVDALGDIISVMSLFPVVYSGNPYSPYDHFDDDWIYGDGSPVEEAWMATSAYAFSIQEFLYLMRPASYGELMWDTLGTELSAGMITDPLLLPGIQLPVMSNTNWQYVQNNSFTSSDPFFAWMRPKNKDQIVHAEIVDSIIEVRVGYQRWISDRILFLGKNVADTFGQKIRTLDVNLANKLAGFTNKDTTNTYLESITPGASTNTLIIPSTNFDVILHKSPSVDTYSYSGVIIRALADGTFVIYGYDLLSAEFTVLDRTTDKLIDVTVGGTPAEYLHFEIGATYNMGDIVRYNGVYYVSLAVQTVSRFIPTAWQKLNSLPVVGGVSVTYKPISATTTTLFPYGSIFRNAQAVFDFLIGWGAYLEAQGWKFDGVSQETNQISDWLYSAKQFLFWLNTSWAPDASIQLSPAANTATLVVRRGYPDDVESLTNGIYSILDKYGVAIAPNDTMTDRVGPLITVSPSNLSAGGIYFLQVNASETEHILIFDNTTNFNDTIYSPLLRVRQQRLRFNGFRSNGWYGKMEAPGYLIIDNQLVPNYDTIVESMRYFYDPNVTIDNPSLEDLGRHLIGYESKSYLDNLQVSNDVQYLFYQGAIRQKGTEQALTKLFRSTKIQSNEIIKVYEEWALKLGSFGNTVEQVSTEFKLVPEQNTGEVIVARLNFVPSNIGFIRQISILNAQNTYTTVPSVVIPLPDAEPVIWSIFDPLVTYNIGDVVKYNDAQNNAVYYSSNISQTGNIPPGSTWTVVLATRLAKAYIILDTVGRISRIDITDPGYGYLIAPDIDINSGTQSHSLDRLYSVWQGAIISDSTLDNVVNIDIDQVDKWTVRPTDPTVSLVFPTTNNIDYPIPNAGYVNFNDVTLSSFDVTQTTVRWGTTNFNPLENNTVWIAKTFTEDWDVYKLIDEPFVDVWVDGSNNLFLRTLQSNPLITPQFSTSGDVTDFGNMLVLQVIEAQAIIDPLNDISAGAIINIQLTRTGANYNSPPLVTIIGDGGGALATATIAGGVVTGFVITNPGAGYTFATVTIAPPSAVASATNYTVGFTFNQIETDFRAPIDFPDVYNYYDLLTLAGNPITSIDIPDYVNFTKLMLFKTMRFLQLSETNIITHTYDLLTISGNALPPTAPVTLPFNTSPASTLTNMPAYVTSGDNIWIDQVGSPVLWTIFKYNGAVLNLFRQQESLINTRLFESASVFNDKGTEIVQLPVYDPFKDILPGPAKQNITYMNLRDPARYNVTGNPRLFSENIIFGENQIGQLWWDLSDTRYVYYEQPMALDGSETEIQNLAYRRDHWAQLFPGSVVGIYEWVKSPVPPTLYTGTGVPRDTTSYVQITTSNVFTSATETNYYFWVFGATDKPNVENRTMAAIDVARMLQSPRSQGFTFFAPIQQTSTDNSYMFYNVQEILAYQGNNIQIQYRISERDDQEHAQWKFFREGDTGSLVTDQFWNKMVDSLCGYTKVLPWSDEYTGIPVWNYSPWDISPWDMSTWDATDYSEILPVPDPTLSEGEKYGILYRPRQGMFVNLLPARKVFVQSANSLLQHIPIRDTDPSWGVSLPGWNSTTSTDYYFDTYWTYTNWYAIGFEGVLPTIVYPTLTAANTALTLGELQIGTILQVNNGTIDGRYALYVVVKLNPNISTLSLEEVCIQNSAIKLLDTVYTSVNKYGLSVELRGLLNTFRTTVMIDNYIVDQNELFFSLLNYVVSEQKNPNWVFKSSYIYIKEDNIPLTQDSLYIPDQINNIIDYIVDSKPYHTQVRDYTSVYTTTDVAAGTASDSYKWYIKLLFGPRGTGYWDTDAWDIYEWDNWNEPFPQYILNAETFADNIDQFVSQENVYTVPLTFYDISKKGYSDLVPYTFNFNSLNLNDPQSFITPYNVVGVQVGSTVLIYGRDYYVEYNNDTTYTAYFYNNPGTSPAPVALVWFDGGVLSNAWFDGYRNELYVGTPEDDFVVNVDTRLPVNIATGIVTPYAGWGDIWEAVVDPVAQILIDAGGTAEIPWDAPLILEILPNTISSKENLTAIGSDFYRNSEIDSGILLIDLPAPQSGLTVYDYNIQVITVYVDPITHPITTDILPNPGLVPGVIWINGERIEYRNKELIAPDTWELKLVARGTLKTSATEHLAMIPSLADPMILVPNPVFIERNNIMPAGSNDDVWNVLTLPAIPDPATEGPVNEFTSVQNVPLGGLWYAQTPEAIFLKDEQGISIP